MIRSLRAASHRGGHGAAIREKPHTIENSFRRMVSHALEKWRPLIEAQPRIAREKDFWEREAQE